MNISPPDKSVISVIIPVYNSEKTIQRAINSVVQQNYKGTLEIVIIDDGSTDNTVKTIHKMGVSQCQVYSQSNSGASASRFNGVKKSSGDIVMFLDADDLMLPDHVSSHVKALKSDKESIFSFGFCESYDEFVDKYKTVGQLLKNNKQSDHIKIPDSLFSLLQDGCFPLSMNVACYREKAIQAMTGRAHIRAANDYDFCLRLSIQGQGMLLNHQTIKIERFDHGITGMNKGLQPTFASIVANEAVSLSKKGKSIKIKNALKHRVETTWPAGFMHCLWNGYYKMAFLVAWVGVTKGCTRRAFRNIYWTWDHLKKGTTKKNIN